MGIKIKINTLMLLATLLALRITTFSMGGSVVVRRASGTEDYNVETEAEAETETEIVNEYTEDDLYVLSHIIQCEAGNCQREMMEGVGSVVLNRVTDPRFPNTITEVVNEPGQYTPVASGAFASAQPTELVMEVAVDLLEHGSKFPPEVVWQANFPQGEGTYLPLDPPPGVGSRMYFCY